jgi:uncharacterized membrane protein YjjP (DUF1212 family)
MTEPDKLNTTVSASKPTYRWWIGVIMLLMAALIMCVLCGEGMSAIAFAIVIHAAANIQQAEADRD